MLRHLARLLLIMGPLGCPCDPCEKAAFFFVQDEMICVTMRKLMNIKRNFIVLLTIAGTFGSIASGLAQTKDSSPAAAPGEKKESAAPKIQFAEMVYDFGKVTSGELVKHTFVFTNIGTATLEIKDVRPGCGCTTAGTWDKVVEPGKTGSIPLQFNSANFGGTVMKQATVTCNDLSQSNVLLQIKGTVWKPIEVTPTMAVFNISSEAQTNDTKVVRIVSNLDQPLTLSDLQCTNSSFKAELKTVKEGKEFELQITAIAPFNSPSVVAPVTLKTSSTNMPVINVSAYAVVQQPVTVAPSQIILPPGPFTNVVHHVITIRNSGTNSLVLSDANVNVPGTEVHVQETQPGRSFNLSVDFPAGFEVKAGQQVEVSVKSNHPKFPLIKVPVFQPQRPPTAAALQGVSPATRVVPAKPPAPADK